MSDIVSSFLDVDILQRAKNLGSFSTAVPILSVDTSVEPAADKIPVATEAGVLEAAWLPAAAGDVDGPATAVDGNLAVFDGVTGKLIKDGGAPYVLPTATDAVLGGIKIGSGLTITDGVVAAAGDVDGPATAVDGNLVVFDGETGKLIKDGGAPYVLPTATDAVLGGIKIGSGLTITDGVVATEKQLPVSVVVAESDLLADADVENTVIVNLGQAANMDITLPKAGAGMKFQFVAVTAVANYLHFVPDATDVIIFDSTALTAGYYVGIPTVAIGNSITFISVQTAAESYGWFAFAITGAWAAQGA